MTLVKAHATLRVGMMDFFAWLERTPLSIYMREDFYAYFIVLIFHSLGMAFLVGGGLAVSLRAAGVAKQAPLEKFRGFFPVMWVGLAMAVVSGVLLVVGYPAKALTNPIFPLKFVFLIGAGVLIWLMAKRLFPIAARGEPLPDWSRALAIGALVLWLAGVAAGKLLLYTYSILLVT
jgi:hypothetical protein